METSDALASLSALAHPGRLAIVRHLVRAGPAGGVAGDIAQALAMPASTLSAHLAHLERAGLAASAREGRHVRYTARIDGMQALINYLLADCCGGSPEQCRLVFDTKPCC